MQSKASVILGYGSSGTGKSYQIRELCEYIFQTTGKLTRIVTADGGAPDWFHNYRDAGMAQIEAVGPTTPNATEHIDRLCQGFWPTLKDGKAVWSKDGLDKVGAYAIEGLTSIGDLIMADLRGRGARLSQDPNFALKMGETTYYGSNMTYYGFIQERLYDFVMKTHMLPVSKVYWTATETRGEDDGTKVYGPAIAGKKSIGKAPQWFGDCLHYEMLLKEGQKDSRTGQIPIITTRVMYLQPHADPNTKLVFPAKVRVGGGTVPEYLEPPSLRKLFELQDSFRNAEMTRLQQMVAAKV